MKKLNKKFDKKAIVGALKESRPADELFARAKKLTDEVKGDLVNVRAIIEYSSYCGRNCAYCGLNRENTSLTRYRMQPEEIIDTAIEAADAGYKTVVLQSGEDAFYTTDVICDIIKEIKQKRDIAVTLSSGEMSREAYDAIRKSGCDRYLLKHETSDPLLFALLHPDCSFAKRAAALRTLKELGFETGGGFMIGLPGQTLETIASDLLFLSSVPCDMAGIGPFIPHPQTPLGGEKPGSCELTLRAVAIARLLMPEINLPATTSLGVLDLEERNRVFGGGANVIMKKVTPEKYRALYEIYPVSYGKIKSIAEEREEINLLLKSIGKTFD